jgi:DtxR family manganese transport transcriptional regulator
MSLPKIQDKERGNLEETRFREEVIREVVLRAGKRLSHSDISDIKKELCVSRASAYRMIKTFRTCGAVVARTKGSVGRPRGTRVLDATRESLIRDAIISFYLVRSRPTFGKLVHEINRRCLESGLPAPNWRTIKTRVRDLDSLTSRLTSKV